MLAVSSGTVLKWVSEEYCSVFAYREDWKALIQTSYPFQERKA
jgi:hypothetical protein